MVSSGCSGSPHNVGIKDMQINSQWPWLVRTGIVLLALHRGCSSGVGCVCVCVCLTAENKFHYVFIWLYVTIKNLCLLMVQFVRWLIVASHSQVIRYDALGFPEWDWTRYTLHLQRIVSKICAEWNIWRFSLVDKLCNGNTLWSSFLLQRRWLSTGYTGAELCCTRINPLEILEMSDRYVRSSDWLLSQRRKEKMAKRGITNISRTAFPWSICLFYQRQRRALISQSDNMTDKISDLLSILLNRSTCHHLLTGTVNVKLPVCSHSGLLSSHLRCQDFVWIHIENGGNHAKRTFDVWLPGNSIW